ncbi:hypothetical protein F9U64_22375 [Gracilibacillus oryzae]|uniref:Uncharacterized protein n=1 Tax=Gracilibacillus oryzae TaxID=1672701 RepID=A0A7C8GQG4_9BACI|nr:hypothetical protein [Gracilibacillus oryzae]KAB8125582.1 hypothetical protein F9U64_22375 [Gracilibacillus oryzae]
MSTLLTFYKNLDDDLFQKIGYSEQPIRASYINEENELIEMEVALEEGQENTFHLLDPKVHLAADVHDVNLNFELEIENPQFLFGPNGLSDEDGVLGIAVRWYSRDSAQMKIQPVSTLTASDEHFYNETELTIEKGIIRGKLTIEIILYMAQPGIKQKQIASGTVLGTLHSTLILIDGNSSMFPILEVDDPSRPLWWVECNFEDPLYDSFTDDNVAIIINIGHRNARHLKLEKGIGSSPLLLEILATGMQIIIEEAKETGEWDDILRNRSEPGSIGEAIYYFTNMFLWDISSPKKLLKSIRDDFNGRF